MSIKHLFDFSINQEKEVDDTEVSTNEKGETVTITKKIKKNVPQKFFLIKPSRSLQKDGDMFYRIKVNECIKAGLMSRVLLSKRYLDDGGVLSRTQKDFYSNLDDETISLQSEYQRINLTAESDRTPEQNDIIKAIIKRLSEVRVDVQNFELAHQSLFENTAENVSRNETVLWWVTQLSYSEENGPFFGDGPFDARLDKYDELVEKQDPFINSVIEKFIYYVTFWYATNATKQEDFLALDKQDAAASTPETNPTLETKTSTT